MAWIETESPNFLARHAEAHREDADAVLEALEQQRQRLEQIFPRVPERVTVVLHDSTAQLLMAQPWLALARVLSSPAGRRYMAGWYSRGEVHCLSPTVLRRLAAGDDSLKAMLLTPQRYHSMLTVGLNNPLLPPPFRPVTLRRLLRRPWHAEGAGQYFSGQVAHLRAAIAIRMRQGSPHFPPSRRDAALLGGTVYDLLAQQRDQRACLRLACHPDKRGDHELLESTFDASRHEITQMWRAHLERLSSPEPHVAILED